MKRFTRTAITLLLTFVIVAPAFAMSPRGAYLGRGRPARRTVEKEAILRYVTKTPTQRFQARQVARLRRPVLPRRLVETGLRFERPTRRAIENAFWRQRI